MRLHKNLVVAVIKVLDGVFNQNLYADKTIEKVLKLDKRWGSRDRGFIAETSYDIVRWKRLYSEIAEAKSPYKHKELWKIFAVWAVLKGIQLPNWPELNETPKRRIKGKFDELIKIMNDCLYVVGNESGPICIGAALKKNVLSIYYPKHTNKSSKTINKKVKFFNTDIIASNNIISKILKILQ